MSYTFPKSQRLCSQLLEEQLFAEGKSLTAFPLRAVYMPVPEGATQLLISVPKRRMKHAVDRNRLKRQVREAWRHNRQLLPAGHPVVIAFISLTDAPMPSPRVEGSVRKLLQRISEKILHPLPPTALAEAFAASISANTAETR